MAADDGRQDAWAAELYARARQARAQSWVLQRQVRAARQQVAANREQLRARRARAEQLAQLWPALEGRDRLRYSAISRLQARLASMPVIEQAKGIMMAECGWTAEQAFDALRQASQRENVKVRELAARIVTRTADPAASGRDLGPGQRQPSSGEAGVRVLAADRHRSESA
jgi:hypothetical protein